MANLLVVAQKPAKSSKLRQAREQTNKQSDKLA